MLKSTYNHLDLHVATESYQPITFANRQQVRSIDTLAKSLQALSTRCGTREKNENNNTIEETYFGVNLGHVKGPFQLNIIIIIINNI